jgi:hypothetical protein
MATVEENLCFPGIVWVHISPVRQHAIETKPRKPLTSVQSFRSNLIYNRPSGCDDRVRCLNDESHLAVFFIHLEHIFRTNLFATLKRDIWSSHTLFPQHHLHLPLALHTLKHMLNWQSGDPLPDFVEA